MVGLQITYEFVHQCPCHLTYNLPMGLVRECLILQGFSLVILPQIDTFATLIKNSEFWVVLLK